MPIKVKKLKVMKNFTEMNVLQFLEVNKDYAYNSSELGEEFKRHRTTMVRVLNALVKTKKIQKKRIGRRLYYFYNLEGKWKRE